MHTHSEVLKQIGILAARGLSRGELTKQQRIDVLREIEALANQPAPLELSDDMRAELTVMRSETGWAEIGGRLIRDATTGEVCDRTKWVANADWWPGRPKGLNEKQVQAAIDHALAGETLSKAERLLVDYLIDFATARSAAVNVE